MTPQIELYPDHVRRPDVLIPASYWSSRNIDAVIVCLPKPLAGEGTRRQVQGVVEGLNVLDVPVCYVGPAVEEGPPALARPAVTVPTTSDIPSTYRAVAEALAQQLAIEAYRSCRSVLVLSMGYTAFGPFGLSRALDAASNFRGRVTCCIVDSAFPDTDDADRHVDAEGWPLSRFHHDAYAATERVDTLFLLTSAYPYDPRVLETRLPAGMTGVGVIAPPYTDQYVRRIEELAFNDRLQRGELAAIIPSLRDWSSSDLLAPVVSSDIWSESAVDVWMTAAQHETCTTGTRNLVAALHDAANRLRRQIWVPIHSSGARMLAASADSLPRHVTVLEQPAAIPETARVVVAGYDYIPQDSHTSLLAMSDLALGRTGGQSNATAVLAISGTPHLVMDMPARGYMQSELTSLALVHDTLIDQDGSVRAVEKSLPLGWLVAWNDPVEQMATVLVDALREADPGRRRGDSARRAFGTLFYSPTGNLLRLVQMMVKQS